VRRVGMADRQRLAANGQGSAIQRFGAAPVSLIGDQAGEISQVNSENRVVWSDDLFALLHSLAQHNFRLLLAILVLQQPPKISDGVECRGVVRAQRFAADIERFFEKRPRLLEPAQIMQKVAKIAEALGKVRVQRAEPSAPDFDRFAKERLSFALVAASKQ